MLMVLVVPFVGSALMASMVVQAVPSLEPSTLSVEPEVPLPLYQNDTLEIASAKVGLTIEALFTSSFTEGDDAP